MTYQTKENEMIVVDPDSKEWIVMDDEEYRWEEPDCS